MLRIGGTRLIRWPYSQAANEYGDYNIQRIRVWFEYALTEEEIACCYKEFLADNPLNTVIAPDSITVNTGEVIDTTDIPEGDNNAEVDATTEEPSY